MEGPPGAAAGPVVAVLGRNAAEYAAAVRGALARGATPALLSWRWGGRELAAAIRDLRPALLLVDAASAPLAAAAAARLRRRSGAGPPLLPLGTHRLDAAGVAAAALGRLPPAGGAGGTGGVVCFTTGSTGRPKAAVLPAAAFELQARSKIAVIGYGPGDVHLHCAPLFHVGGLCAWFTAELSGGRHVFMPRFEAGPALELIRAHRVTALIAVPAMVDDLFLCLHARAGPAAAAAGCPTVRRVLVGGGALSAQQRERAEQVFPGASLFAAYGLTEACSSVALAALRLAPDADPHPPLARAFLLPAEARAEAAAAAAADAASPLPGRYADPRHPGCPRRVAFAEGAALVVEGDDGDPGRPWTVRGRVVPDRPDGGAGSRVVVDFGPKGGPRDLRGEWDAGAAGIRWADGNTWTKLAPDLGTCVGAAAPHCEVRVVLRRGGEDAGFAGPGAEGEVVVRGGSVMRGYLGDTAATVAAFLPGGGAANPGAWLRTGDLGRLDGAGRLWLSGRAKDVIRTGAETVHPAEVERLLRRCPGVADAAVVGLPHARLGEQVAALVQSDPGAAGVRVDAAAVRAHCRRAGCAGYKVPRVVVAVPEALPRRGIGKVDRARVRAVLLAARRDAERGEAGGGEQRQPRSKL